MPMLSLSAIHSNFINLIPKNDQRLFQLDPVVSLFFQIEANCD